MTSDGSLSASELRPYQPPPTPVDPAYRRDESPVRIAVRHGWWRLFRVQDPKGSQVPVRICAELVTDVDDVLLPGVTTNGGAATVSVRRATVADIEEVTGFALPAAAADALLRAAPRAMGASAGRAAAIPQKLGQVVCVPALRHDYLPWRASRVDLVGQPSMSYGRLLHSDPPLRSWQRDAIRLDVQDAGAVRSRFGIAVCDVVYRIWLDGRIIVSARTGLDAGVDPHSDEAIRVLASRSESDDRRLGPCPPGRSDYYGWVQRQLALMIARRVEPFPVGTRVVIAPGFDVDSPSGTVLARTGGGDIAAGVPARYLVRPDAADLPGHRWQDLPRAGCRLPGSALRPTLLGPDPGLPTASAEPVPLAFGARIRSIDDPVIDEATVLRTHARAGGLVYEVQPDGRYGLDGVSRLIDAGDAVPIRGTAWASVAALEAGRAAAGIELVPGEVLETISERRVVGATEFAPRDHLAAAMPPLPDPSGSYSLDPTPIAGL